MKILIIEDEQRIARRLARMTSQYFQADSAISICEDLESGFNHLDRHAVDLLLLDLNLNGEDGFDVLEKMVSRSFQTIVVSAYTDRAITAYAYGVLDFVPKPFDQERLFQAFGRLNNNTTASNGTLKYLAIRSGGAIKLVDIKQVCAIKASGIYSELQLLGGGIALHDKGLDALEKLLPTEDFVRIHRSHIIRWDGADKLIISAGGRYSLLCKNGALLPVGRSRYKLIREQLSSRSI